MANINQYRRLILKGAGAFGVSGIIISCGGGSSGSSSTASRANSNGNTVNLTNKSKGNSAPSCNNASASIPVAIDASVLATGIPENVPIYAYISGQQSVSNIQYLYDPVQKNRFRVIVLLIPANTLAQEWPPTVQRQLFIMQMHGQT